MFKFLRVAGTRFQVSGLLLFSVFFCPSAVLGDDRTIKLKDPRDGQVYKARRMADGRVWMTEDLRYGNCRELTAEDYAAGSKKAQSGVLKGKDKTSLYGVCIYRFFSGGGTCLYNWQAAMQDERAFYGSSIRDTAWAAGWQGICPAGWHLPSAEEWRGLYQATGDQERVSPRLWLGIPNDYAYSNGLFNYGSFGGFWSSTAVDDVKAFSLHYNNIYADPGYGFDRSWGRAVRCVATAGTALRQQHQRDR